MNVFEKLTSESKELQGDFLDFLSQGWNIVMYDDTADGFSLVLSKGFKTLHIRKMQHQTYLVINNKIRKTYENRKNQSGQH